MKYNANARYIKCTTLPILLRAHSISHSNPPHLDYTITIPKHHPQITRPITTKLLLKWPSTITISQQEGREKKRYTRNLHEIPLQIVILNNPP